MDQKLSLAPMRLKFSGFTLISFSQISAASSSSSNTVTHNLSADSFIVPVRNSQA